MNAPDHVVRRLKTRAGRHRSLQGELLALPANAVRDEPFLSADEAHREIRRLDLNTGSESADLVRSESDAR